MSIARARGLTVAVVALTVSAGCGGGSPPVSASQKGVPRQTYVVSLLRPEGGAIDSADGRIHCGKPGVADACGPVTYAWTDIATLSATPDPGGTFGTWAGDCSGRQLCVLDTKKYGADKYVLAIFGRAGVASHPNFTSPAVHGPEYFNTLGHTNDPLAGDNVACHGPALNGGGMTPSCSACHARGGWTSWRTNCSFCHGVKSAASQAGYDFATSPALAAPGDAISARLTGTPAPDRTGAHQAHLTGTTAGGLALTAPFACATCHAVPSDLSHVTGAGARATVRLSGAGQGSLSASLGAYNPATGTCSTYCHAPSSPAWSATGLKCGDCHSIPPPWPHMAVTDLKLCSFCHAETMNPDGTIRTDTGKHVNGIVDLVGGATGDGTGCAACHGAPPSTGAHLAHHGASAPPPAYGDTRPLGCGNCHPSDPNQHAANVQVLSPNVVLPGGTRTTGAQLIGSGLNATCSVACHFPLGAPQPAQPVAWTRGGPLPCTSCHSAINPGPTSPSLHDPIFSEARPASGEATTCWTCHDAAAHDASHLTGAPALIASASVDAACIACHTPPPGPTGPSQVLHRGSGASYVERTPPVLRGWTDTASGDFHGARVGTGWYGTFGGTLKPPYVTGQGPLPCTSCHAGHASGNAFLFAASVNGSAIPTGRITRAGVGAEVLCGSCHVGENHAACLACHASDPQPAGSACFYCHGHEGIRHFPSPYFTGDHMEPAAGRDCSHCHSTWLPLPDSVPPGFYAAPQVTGVTATAATVSWTTNEGATTYVEYGVGTAGYVVGNDAEVGPHSVTLTGLSPSTTYVWRVRSSDGFRNVTESALQSFTTPGANDVPRPDLVAVWIGTTVPNTTVVGTLKWYPVNAPSGTAVEYEVQLASDPGFTSLVNAALARTDPSLPTGNSGWISGAPTTDSGSPAKPALGFDVTFTNLPQDWCFPIDPNVYYYRVRARDQAGNVSEWSAPQTISVMAGDPLC